MKRIFFTALFVFLSTSAYGEPLVCNSINLGFIKGHDYFMVTGCHPTSNLDGKWFKVGSLNTIEKIEVIKTAINSDRKVWVDIGKSKTNLSKTTLRSIAILP